jgi:hypothetical protein
LMKNGYKYYHYGSEYDGSRDINGDWIYAKHHLSKKDTIFLNKTKLLIIFLTNNIYSKKHQYFLKMSENEILNSDMLISRLFKQSLNMR